MPSHSSRERGFALLEVLVAMLLVAVALLGVTGLQLAALRSGADLLRLLGASSHAAAHAERLRALHDAPPEAREILATRGARRGCRDERRCTPLEFAEDEAARWLDEAQDAPFEPALPVVAPDAAPTHWRLRVGAAGGPLVDLEVAS